MTDRDVLTVRGLRKSYGGRTVVDGVDFEVSAGEIVGVIGANGAGKTTTVECIQGLRRPDAGSIRVLGCDPLKDRDSLRTLVGSQLQSAGLPDRLRVGEAVRLFSGRGADDLLAQFGLSQRRSSAFASLSGGERQRLFLVLALANRPRLVILDELTQGLDPTARRNVWAAVDELRTSGVTVLLVTHELDEAEQLCDRVLAMRSGRVLGSGSPAELIDRHGASAEITFTAPPGWPPGGVPSGVAELPGAQGARVLGGRVTISGDRRLIAHVGAYLVAGGSVPADLSVRLPSLEDSLVALLERDEAPLPGTDHVPDLPALSSGATR